MRRQHQLLLRCTRVLSSCAQGAQQTEREREVRRERGSKSQRWRQTDGADTEGLGSCLPATENTGNLIQKFVDKELLGKAHVHRIIKGLCRCGWVCCCFEQHCSCRGFGRLRLLVPQRREPRTTQSHLADSCRGGTSPGDDEGRGGGVSVVGILVLHVSVSA